MDTRRATDRKIMTLLRIVFALYAGLAAFLAATSGDADSCLRHLEVLGKQLP